MCVLDRSAGDEDILGQEQGAETDGTQGTELRE